MINIREALQDSIFELLRPYRSSEGSLFNKGQYIELSYHSKDPHQKRIVSGGSRPFLTVTQILLILTFIFIMIKKLMF